MAIAAAAAKGTMPYREQLGGGKVKGSIVRAHRDWVRDHASREETIEFFEELPAALRHELTTVLASSWYDFALLIALDRAILARFGNGDLRFLEELGAHSARLSLEGVARTLQRDRVHEFFRRAAFQHRQFQNFGASEYIAVSATRGRAVHRGSVTFSPIYCASAAGFYRECVRLHHFDAVSTEESSCMCAGDAACAFELEWR